MPIEVMQALSWVPLLLVLGSALMCFIHLRLSRRMWLLLAGFLGLASADIGVKVLDALILAQKMAWPDVIPARTTLVFVRGISWGMIFGGLVRVLPDLRERVDMPPRDDSTDNRPPWQKD